MTVQDLNRVHSRYIRLSSFFKSAWTFHQFLQGMEKVYGSIGSFENSDEFQAVYADLKRVSQDLSETTAGIAAERLDGVENHLGVLVADLLAADAKVPPGDLRRFFQRVKNYDDNILTQLAKFYLYAKNGSAWPADRLDKVDFLSTKLAEEYHDTRDLFVLKDPSFVRELAQGMWMALGINCLSETEIAAFGEELREHGRQIDGVETMDDLHAQQLIPAYRDLKHQLGDRFFHPRLLQSVLATNLELKNKIHQLYRYEEQRIVAEYQQVFELERDVPVDVQLGAELSQFREEVERFEQQLQGSNVRIDDLAALRQKVRELVPKLRRQPVDDGPYVEPAEVRKQRREELAGVEELPAVGASARTGVGISNVEFEYVRDHYEAIVAALDDTNPTIEARKVVLQPEVFALGLSPREVVAYRRLYGGGTCDLELEQFVLQSAALRCRIEREVEEIKEILDDTAVTRDAPVFGRARKTTRLADLYLRRFEHRVEQAVLQGDAAEARNLQLLKMRMMRGFSGLWLMVYRD